MASSSVAAPKPPALTITSPLLRAKFYISKDATWPSVVFQTDAALQGGAELEWRWSIEWGRFCECGVEQTSMSCWDAQCAIANRGGVLSVSAVSSTGIAASTEVEIVGTQPDDIDIQGYLASCPDSSGFDRILKHETGMKHFDAAGHPLCSFDNGFGMAQLTNPAPDFGQVWNWKMNVAAGLRLYAQKRALAAAYLSRKGSCTDQQLVYETISRWNGGSYHIWDAQQGWVRKPTILCDSKTRNIGWDMTKQANHGLNEDQLHMRDAGCYGRSPKADEAWGYFGVCYADAVLGS